MGISNNEPAFFGEITASVTHELQNVLAIIKENSGLMEDILLMSRNSAPELAEKLQKSISSIKKQVYRGVNLTSELNGFSHTTDHVETQVNIYEILKRLIFLAGRITKLKGVEVTIEKCEKHPSILTNPMLFQIVVYRCIECLINISVPKTNISIEITGTNILFKWGSTDVQGNDFIDKITNSIKWAEINNACQQINFKTGTMTATPGIILTFFKPQEPNK